MTSPQPTRTTGRSALVTGASTGIGRVLTRMLVQQGWRVFAGVRSQAAAGQLSEDFGDRVAPVQLDVTCPEQIAQAVATVSQATGGRLEALVNNAGIVVAGPLEFLPIERLREQLEINVIGQVAVTQAAAAMVRAARGRIVLMGSISGRFASPIIAPYAMSKFALEALADSLRVEMKPHGVSVSLIEPGAVATPIWEKSRNSAMDTARDYPSQARELYGAMSDGFERMAAKAAGRATPPEEVGRAVLHALQSPRPRTRYLVGTDAKLRGRLFCMLPDRWRDALLLKALRLK